MRTIPLLLALSLAAPPPARPAEQEPPPAFVPAPAGTPATRPAQEQPTILPVTAAEVGVDFVVRDKKGRIVRDLKPSDIEVYEDGVRQEIGLFRLVSTAPADAPPEGAPEAAPPVAGASAPAGAPPAPDVDREAVVALVFDRLSPAARVSAHDAALAWLKTPAVAGREVGVFRIDQGLEEVQGFTDDRGPVMDALEDVARAAPTSFQSHEDRQKLRTLREQLALLEGRVLNPGGPQSAADSGAGLVVPEAKRSQSYVLQEVARRQLATEVAMLSAMESLERDQQGLATTNALLALVNGLRERPGRKAVVFFSEGLLLPDRVTSTFLSVVSEANRSGVSFYAADAAGLRVRSGADETRRELAASSDVIDSATQGDSAIASQSSMTRLVERNQDVMRSDPAAGLGSLARDTGGFLIRDTNDIALGLKRVEEELGSYYLLSYAPKNESWDGHYRKIELRSRRSGLTVQARRGYYAVRTPTPTPVLDHEAAALAWVEQGPATGPVEVRARAIVFPGEGGESTVALVAELPGGAASLAPDRGDASTLRQEFTLLALVRDASGRVVHKSSGHYELSWPKSKAPEVKAGRVLFARDASLPPGRYTVETVVWDAQAARAGVHRASVVVPPESVGTQRLSPLVIVGHAEKHALGDASPLLYQGMLLYPTFGEPVGRGKPLAFLFVLRPGRGPLPAASVELAQGDETVRRALVPLTAPDDSGVVRVVGGLPVDGLEPGEYVLRLVLSDGRSMTTRSADVTLAP
jgi:VWFA-related protein